jgi:TspO/MBR family
MTWMEWYDSLVKPSWTPAPSTISLIWALLYPVILVSFGFVFVQAFRRKIPRRVALPFAVNLVANALWDRPPEQWPRTPGGELTMFTRRLDLNGLLREIETPPIIPVVDEGPKDLCACA